MRLVWALLLVCVVIMTKRVVYHAATIKTQSTPRLLCISLNRRTKREVMNGGAEMNNLTFVEFCQLPRLKACRLESSLFPVKRTKRAFQS